MIRVGLLAALALPLVGGQAGAEEAGKSPFQFRPELWPFYKRNADDTDEVKFDLRLYQVIDLPERWVVNLRWDLPLLLTDKPGPENEDGDWGFGIGDLFLDAMISTPAILPNLSLAFGGRFYAPTGGDGPYGNGQWTVGPQAAVQLHVPGVARGLDLDPTLRYVMSVASIDEDAAEIRRYDLYPKISVTFADGWKAGLWPENPIIYNDLTDRWFVPLDMMVNRQMGPFALGLGVAVSLVDDYPQYKRLVYGRLSFSF